MRVVKFNIANFKGISKTSINLADEVPGNIIMLIGLNESGKTTILEALSHFVTEDLQTASLVGTVHQKSRLEDLVPKDKKAAFSGTISVKIFAELDGNDIEKLYEIFYEKHKLQLDKSSMVKEFTIDRSYIFEDSTFKEQKSYYSSVFGLKAENDENYTKYTSDGSTRKIWVEGIDAIRALVPQIVYFPTFLFDFPDKIYLEEQADETEIDKYYRQVVQDILDSMGEGLSVEKHIVDRVKKVRKNYRDSVSFLSHFLGRDEKTQIDAVTQKISNEMSRMIFGAWAEILGRSVMRKRVQVDWFIDVEADNSPFIQVSIVDGQSKYALSERSLGFRWFFSFLLFTQFRRNRNANVGTIFLFDEPASNLHSKAQIKLLDSFSKIANEKCYIIYSTHSHFMVNPLWLEKSYIVDNRAIDYDDEEQVDSFAIRRTDIVATKYRTFVASHPSKTTYFQPVLDALDVVVSPMERSSNALIVEGKFDFHPFCYLWKVSGGDDGPAVFPANGTGDIANLINLFRGWGVNFRILLDDDAAGRQAKKRFEKDYLVPTGHAVTLGDLSQALKGRSFEGLYASDVVAAVPITLGVKKVTKRHYALFFQELIASGESRRFPQTEARFSDVFDWVRSTFNLA